MWCDNFDGDLYKLIPEAREIVSLLANVELFTHGHLGNDGRLNHPAVWNDYKGMIAFFGLEHPYKPDAYWTNDPMISCTAEEAIRDCFVHQYVIIVNTYPVWDSFRFGNDYINLLYDHRGIHPMVQIAKEHFIQDVMFSLRNAVSKIRMLQAIFACTGVEGEEANRLAEQNTPIHIDPRLLE